MFSKLLLFTHSAQKFLFKLCCYFAIQLYLIFLQFLMGNVEVLHFWAGKRVILSLYWSVSWGLLKWKFLLTFVLFNYLRKIIWLGVLLTWVKFYSLYTREETGMLFLLKCTIYMYILYICDQSREYVGWNCYECEGVLIDNPCLLTRGRKSLFGFELSVAFLFGLTALWTATLHSFWWSDALFYKSSTLQGGEGDIFIYPLLHIKHFTKNILLLRKVILIYTPFSQFVNHLYWTLSSAEFHI